MMCFKLYQTVSNPQYIFNEFLNESNAIIENEAEAVRLIEGGTDANIADDLGQLPLHWSAKWGGNIGIFLFNP